MAEVNTILLVFAAGVLVNLDYNIIKLSAAEDWKFVFLILNKVFEQARFECTVNDFVVLLCLFMRTILLQQFNISKICGIYIFCFL